MQLKESPNHHFAPAVDVEALLGRLALQAAPVKGVPGVVLQRDGYARHADACSSSVVELVDGDYLAVLVALAGKYELRLVLVTDNHLIVLCAASPSSKVMVIKTTITFLFCLFIYMKNYAMSAIVDRNKMMLCLLSYSMVS